MDIIGGPLCLPQSTLWPLIFTSTPHAKYIKPSQHPQKLTSIQNPKILPKLHQTKSPKYHLSQK